MQSTAAQAPQEAAAAEAEVFRGFSPTGSPSLVRAALFQFEGPAIAQLWVLGDPLGFEVILKANQAV